MCLRVELLKSICPMYTGKIFLQLCCSALLWKFQFSSVQSLSRVRFFATPWIAACQASLSITNSCLGQNNILVLGSPGDWILPPMQEMGLIPGLGRSFGRGNGNPLQYSCLKNCMDRKDRALDLMSLKFTWFLFFVACQWTLVSSGSLGCFVHTFIGVPISSLSYWSPHLGILERLWLISRVCGP